MKAFGTSGVCAREIEVEVNEEGIITDIHFLGGCDGNTKGLETLIKGFHKDEVIKRLRGITCKTRPTSCPDQLAQILENNF